MRDHAKCIPVCVCAGVREFSVEANLPGNSDRESTEMGSKKDKKDKQKKHKKERRRSPSSSDSDSENERKRLKS